MRRSVKYGAYGAIVAAALVGGTAAFAASAEDNGKTITLVVDGQHKTVDTTASTVESALTGAGYTLTRHDIVAPSADSAVKDDSTIVLKRGRYLKLDVDGAAVNVWTTAPTVAQALSELGYSSENFVSVSRSARLPLGTTSIDLREPKRVVVAHDGTKKAVLTTDVTAREVVAPARHQAGQARLPAPRAARTPVEKPA